MKSRDRVLIHYLDVHGVLRWGRTGASDMRDEDGHVLDGPFERWIVVEDTGQVFATWVHEDHLIFSADPDAGDTGIDVKAIHGVINGPAAARIDSPGLRIVAHIMKPAEIAALHLVFEAVKLWHSAGQPRIARALLLMAQNIAASTPEAHEWIEETNAWIESLNEDGTS